MTYFVEHYRTYFGPVRKAFEALVAADQRALTRDLVELLEGWSTSGDETVVLHSEYLETVAVGR